MEEWPTHLGQQTLKRTPTTSPSLVMLLYTTDYSSWKEDMFWPKSVSAGQTFKENCIWCISTDRLRFDISKGKNQTTLFFFIFSPLNGVQTARIQKEVVFYSKGVCTSNHTCERRFGKTEQSILMHKRWAVQTDKVVFVLLIKLTDNSKNASRCHLHKCPLF